MCCERSGGFCLLCFLPVQFVSKLAAWCLCLFVFSLLAHGDAKQHKCNHVSCLWIKACTISFGVENKSVCISLGVNSSQWISSVFEVGFHSMACSYSVRQTQHARPLTQCRKTMVQNVKSTSPCTNCHPQHSNWTSSHPGIAHNICKHKWHWNKCWDCEHFWCIWGIGCNVSRIERQKTFKEKRSEPVRGEGMTGEQELNRMH